MFKDVLLVAMEFVYSLKHVVTFYNVYFNVEQ